MKKNLLIVILAIVAVFGLSSAARAAKYNPAQETSAVKYPQFSAIHCIQHPEDCEQEEPEEEPEEEPQEEPEVPAENPDPAPDPGSSTNNPSPAQPVDTVDVGLGSSGTGGCQMAPEALEGMGLRAVLPFLLSTVGFGLARLSSRRVRF